MSTPLLFVTPLYAAGLTVLFLILTINIIKLRNKHRIALLDGGVPDLQRAIRIHANFTEFVPLCLILLAFAELNGARDLYLHIIGSILLIARILHALSIHVQVLKMRVVAMMMTFSTLVLSLILLITSSFGL